MGKANRIRANKAHEQVRSLDVKKKKKEMPGWLMTAIAVVITVAVLLTVAVSLLSANGVFGRWTTVMSTDHFKVNANMMSYYFYTQYNNFTTSNSSTISALSLNTQLSLKEQTVDPAKDSRLTGDFTGTWFDFFMSQVKGSVSTILVYCEEAYNNDISLTEEELESIDLQLESLEASVLSSGNTMSSYLSSNYGRGVSVKDVRRAMEYSALASKCASELADILNDQIDSAQINEKYAADPDRFNVIDFSVYSAYVSYAELEDEMEVEVELEEGDTLSDEQKAEVLKRYEAKVEAMKALAAALEKTTDPDAFAKLVAEYVAEETFEAKYKAALKKANKATEDAEEGDENTDITVPSDEDFAAIKQAFLAEIVEDVLAGKEALEEDDIAVQLDDESTTATAYGKEVSVEFAEVLNEVQQEVFAAVLWDYDYIDQEKIRKNEEDEFSKWAFDDAREVGNTKLIEDAPEADTANETKTHTVTVYLLTETKRKDTDLTRNVAYMLFDDTILAGNAIKVLQENETITKEIFEEVARDNKVSVATGKNYLPGSMSGYGALDAWLYGDDLTVGSITVEPKLINSQYMVALYLDDGEEFWYETVKREIFSELSASYEAELLEKYTVTTKEKALKKIDA